MNMNHIKKEIPNELSQNIDNGGEKLKSDKWANGLFSLKSVIARIVKACIPEYTLIPLEIIEAECIDSFVDTSGQCCPEIARTLMTKRPLPNGYMMDCDLLFMITPPKHVRDSWKPQLLNIEIQNDSRLLDRCIGRGMLYASGIYYMEYDEFYTYPEFEKALKVNSVWMCPAAPKKRQGTVLQFRMSGKNLPTGKFLPSTDAFDRLRLTFVNTGGTEGPNRKDICGFVWALTTTRLSSEQRKKRLKEGFGMEMTKTVEKEIDKYDWMLVSYGEDQFEKDKKKCREEGERSGFVKGERSGFVKGEVEKSESIARKLLEDNYPLEKISRVTGLDIPRILQLAKDNNLKKP